MSQLLCCCCFSGENTDEERDPLIQPRSTEPTESARQTHRFPADTQPVRQSGRLGMKIIGLTELDQKFSDVADIFNEQQEHYEAMERCIAHLRQSYGCNHDNTLILSECVNNIRYEHGRQYMITLHIKGYDFSLLVVPLDSEEDCGKPIPQRLRLAQDELKGVSHATKMTISVGTKLQELIAWLLHSEERIGELVKKGAPNFQEQQRLDENLRQNLKEARRAQVLSLRYKQKAGEVLIEAAQIAGAHL